jgi:hypothetical protein
MNDLIKTARKVVRWALWGVVITILLLAFMVWRFDFEIPNTVQNTLNILPNTLGFSPIPFWAVIVMALPILLIFGGYLGILLRVASIVSFGVLIFLFLFDKSMPPLSEFKYVFAIIGAGFVISYILPFISSEIERSPVPTERYFCSKCDQYLGTSRNYDMPCPRCGSNRYKTK